MSTEQAAAAAKKTRVSWRWTRAGWAALAAAGLAAVWWMDQAAYRNLNAQYQAATEASQQLAQQVDRLRGEYRQLVDTVSSQQERTQELTQEVTAKQDALRRSESRLKHSELIAEELQHRLELVQHHFDLLQEEYVLATRAQPARAASPSGSVELERVVVMSPGSAATGWEGRVVSVHPEWQFVVVDLGWELVNLGDLVGIYREGQLVAKARIERIQQTASVATMLPEWTTTQVSIDDAVRAL